LALYRNVLELWCSRSTPAVKLDAISVNVAGTFLCFLQLPPATNDGEMRRFLAITNTKESFTWCVDFSKNYQPASKPLDQLTIILERQGTFPSVDDIHIVSAVDPMGWRATINSESLDVYTREVLITVSKSGKLQTWTTNLSRSSKTLTWLNLSTVPTNISNASLIHGTSERKVAMGNIICQVKSTI
jgi:RAVE protein 1 C terminal